MASMVNLPLTSWTMLAMNFLTCFDLLQFMDVSSLQEPLPSPDLPAFLDGLPERWFPSSSCAYDPSASHGMLSWIYQWLYFYRSHQNRRIWLEQPVHIQVDYRALSSRDRTFLCGKLAPSAACFSVNQLPLFRLLVLWIQEYTSGHCINWKSFCIEGITVKNLHLGDLDLACSFSSVNLELGIFSVRTQTPCKAIRTGGEYDSASRTRWSNV